MIARHAQLRELEAYFQLAHAGAGQVVFLAGDAGVGKTRLVREFATQARSSGQAMLFEGRCYDEDPATPYGPFIDAIRAALREFGPELLIICNTWTDDLARLLPELEHTAPAARASDEPQIQKRQLFEAIYTIIRPPDPQACRIVVLEDFHWSDQTSQELVRYLARAIMRDRLLLIITYRSDELHRRHPLLHLIAQLNRDRLYQEIRLAPLSRDELVGMLEATLDRQLPDSLAEALYDRTGGNPFFAEELLKSLIGHGQLDALIQVAQQGRPIDRLAIPTSIKDAILGRTAELNPTTAEVLTYAAVVGRRFDFDLLLRLTGLAEPELLRAVELLVERQLVVEEPGGPDDRYSFRHALTREAIYDDLLGRERRTRHREVLAALEAIYADRRDEVIDQLAYHSLHGRELEQAARYARLAGERAAQMHAYREAVAHYEVALELLEIDEPGLRADLFERLGHAAYPLGDFSHCARCWREAQRLYEQAGDRRRSANISRWLGRIAWECHDHQAAFAHTRTAIEILEAEPPGRELAMVYSALSQLYMSSSQPDESIAWAEKALRLAEEFGDLAVKTHALNNIGVSLAERGETRRGVICLERSLGLAWQAGLLFDEMRAYLNLGGILPSLGEFRRAAQLLEQGIARARQIHFELYTHKMRSVLCQIELELGHWDRARELYEQLNRRSEAQLPHEREYCPELSEILLRQGQPGEARQLLESLLREAESQGDSHELSALLLALARVYLALGAIDQAVTAIERALAFRHTHPATKSEDLLVNAVEIYLRAGNPERASELLLSRAARAASEENPLSLARLEGGRGLFAAHERRHRDAAGHFLRAAEHWESIELPFEAARARRQRAASLIRLGDAGMHAEALRELALARAAFEALGAQAELAAIDTLARDLARPASASRRNALTPRERQVIALIAQGHSNRQIAETLTISEKTAEIHVSNILSKLGFSSRTQAAAYAVEHNF
jgi:predicted ATPase/DNA-binding CsgD family transcriptional regulator